MAKRRHSKISDEGPTRVMPRRAAKDAPRKPFVPDTASTFSRKESRKAAAPPRAKPSKKKARDSTETPERMKEPSRQRKEKHYMDDDPLLLTDPYDPLQRNMRWIPPRGNQRLQPSTIPEGLSPFIWSAYMAMDDFVCSYAARLDVGPKHPYSNVTFTQPISGQYPDINGTVPLPPLGYRKQPREIPLGLEPAIWLAYTSLCDHVYRQSLSAEQVCRLPLDDDVLRCDPGEAPKGFVWRGDNLVPIASSEVGPEPELGPQHPGHQAITDHAPLSGFPIPAGFEGLQGSQLDAEMMSFYGPPGNLPLPPMPSLYNAQTTPQATESAYGSEFNTSSTSTSIPSSPPPVFRVSNWNMPASRPKTPEQTHHKQGAIQSPYQSNPNSYSGTQAAHGGEQSKWSRTDYGENISPKTIPPTALVDNIYVGEGTMPGMTGRSTAELETNEKPGRARRPAIDQHARGEADCYIDHDLDVLPEGSRDKTWIYY